MRPEPPAERTRSAAAFDLNAYLAGHVAAVNRALADCLEDGEAPTRVVAAMRHALMAGGKRLRPVMCIAASEAVGGAPAAPLMTAACALELVHTYSLVHDDLPAMDDDVTRRGRPTCHVAFDEATAILAGDGLLTLAFERMTAPGRRGAVAPDTWIAVVQELARAAGHRGMIEGQMRDIAAETDPLSRDALEAMHRLKTGAMIRAAVRMGGLLGGAPPGALGALDAYAGHVGLAFQVTDDLLNVEGDPQRMGKAVGTDAAHGKSTYPALLGLAASRELASQLVDRALQALAIFDSTAQPLRAIARYVVERQK